MRAHLDAVRVLLEPTGRPVHLGYVLDDRPTYPYFLLWSSAGMQVADQVDGEQDDLRDTFGLTSVGQTAESALEVAAAGRSRLLGARPAVTGRYVQKLRLVDTRPLQRDDQVKLPATDLNPCYVVDLYSIVSEPSGGAP